MKKLVAIVTVLLAVFCNANINAADASVTAIQRTGSSSYDLNVGDTQTLGYTTTTDSTTSSIITWAADNSSIASVNSSGVVTANSAGSTTITASADGSSCSWSIGVSSSRNSSVSISSQSPAESATDISISKDITFQFSDTMLSSSINDSNIYLRKSGSSSDIDVDVSYNSSSRTVTIDPTSSLDYDTKYYVYVNSSVKDSDGDYIDSDNWYFTTEDENGSTSNTTTSRSPGDGDTNVDLDTTISFYFPNTMTSSTIDEDNIYLRKDGSSTNLPVSVTYSSSSRKVTVTPDNSLSANTEYTLYLSSSIEDSSGDNISSQSWSFTTETTQSNSTTSGTVTTNTAVQTPINNNNAVAVAVSTNGTPTNPVVMLNGKYVSFSGVKPYIKSGRTYLPFRTLFELLGADVTWNAKEEKVTATLNSNTIVLKIGDKTAYKNGNPIRMDVAPEISGGQTIVPLRFAAEGLAVTVAWDKETNTVIMTQ